MGSGYISYYEKESRKPCPKCGSTNFAYDSEHWDYRKKGWADAFIICRACGYRTQSHKSVEEARAEWNSEYRGGLEA